MPDSVRAPRQKRLDEVPVSETHGLSSAEVRARTDNGLVNSVSDPSSRSLWDILRGNLFTLFNAMLGAALIVVLAVGAWKDAVFGFVIVVNTLAGAVTEYRAKRTLDRLAILQRAHVNVLRDGERVAVDSDDLVLDDLVLLASGDQVPADGVVISTDGIDVDESMLTGESDPLAKHPGDEVLSGAAVVAGTAKYRVTAVGADAYAQRITAEAKRFSLVGSELRSSINKILVVISWIIVPIALLLCWSQIRNVGGWSQAFSTGAWRDAIVNAVAGIVGMVPEGLVLLTSINFAIAAIVLARRQVLVQELPAVEVLARVDVLCLDKTGTITDGGIELDELIALAGAGEDPAEEDLSILAALARDPDANPTAAAMGSGLDVRAASLEPLIPFSSARKWSACRNDSGDWIFGAPEVILADHDAAQDVGHQVGRFAGTGARVLLLARVHRGTLVEDEETLSQALASCEPRVLVVLRERVRADAAQTLEYFAEQGVEVKVISGDNPDTVAAIARTVGLAGAKHGVDARTLDEDSLPKAIRENAVFGRVTPEQKRSFVHALQAQGHTVAMTGDGVNDALALKDADLGIAMGNAAPATKAVARLVLMDGKFSTLPGVVSEGRRIIANMERVAALFLTKTTYSVILAVIVALIAWPYPFLPRHLTLVGALTIGTPAFLLALAPNNRIYRPGFLKRVLQLAIPCGVIASAGIISVYSTLRLSGAPEQATTGAALTLLVMALWLLGILARPWNWWRLLLVTAMAAGAVLAVAVPAIRHFFELQSPEPQTFLFVAIIGGLGAALIEAAHRVRLRLQAHR